MSLCKVQVTPTFYHRIAVSAEANGRSMSEEIVFRLNRDFTIEAIMQSKSDAENANARQAAEVPA